MRPFATERRLRVIAVCTSVFALAAGGGSYSALRIAVDRGLGPVEIGVAVTLAMISVIAAGVTGGMILVREYRRVDRLAELALKVADGQIVETSTEIDEGTIGRLSHRITRAAHRVQESVAAVESEKERLKVFLSDVSHQLKTPLAALRVYYEILAGRSPSDEAQRQEFIDRGIAQLDRMEWLIASLLTMARLDAGAMVLERTPESLAETVQSAVAGLAEFAKERSVSVRTTGLEGLGNPPHDVRWLAEAISNLVRNALQHSPRGGEVTVSGESTDVFCRLTVADSGPGIPREELPHVFTRFFHGRSTGSGTGIGLSLTKLIVEHHGGLVSVSSEPGAGSRFTIALPRSLTKL